MENTRVVVISDLHLGTTSRMMSRPKALADFLDHLTDEGGPIDLVIAGDFIDFLGIELDDRYEAWSPPDRARRRLKIALDQDELVYRALHDFLAKPSNALVVLLGNHDVELVLHEIQQAIADRLAARIGRNLLFVADGGVWTCGRLLVEHGNRYDYANLNDWDGLRQTRSAYSRHEEPPAEFENSIGSNMVAKSLSPLKPDYPFLDLLEPYGLLTAYLLVALEPALLGKWSAVLRAMYAGFQSMRNREGHRPPKKKQVGSNPSLPDPSAAFFGVPASFDKLAKRFGVEHPRFAVTIHFALETVKYLLFNPDKNGVASFIRAGKPIPTKQLEDLQMVLREYLRFKKADEDLNVLYTTSDPDPLENAARRIALRPQGQESRFDTVIMGHTHYAVEVPHPNRDVPLYINSGTWIDLITMKKGLLDSPEELQNWLRLLVRNDPSVRTTRSSWADVSVTPAGQVVSAELKRWKSS